MTVLQFKLKQPVPDLRDAASFERLARRVLIGGKCPVVNLLDYQAKRDVMIRKLCAQIERG